MPADQDRYIPRALITLLHVDSSLESSVRSQKDGTFSLTGSFDSGSYLILVEHPAYTPIYLSCRLSDSVTKDLGLIHLDPKSDSLAPVFVMAPTFLPRIKGDTLDFNTENVRMRVNSVVEDLMSRLPGIRIDPDGTIYYNGQKIQKLLVDGQDIFGSDPSLITRNFDASQIAKIQIIDRKSDQAEFTGIDDGSRTKTINLVLKESARNSYFGKGELGAGPEGLFDVNGLLAGFHGKEQLVGLAMASNTGSLGFSNTSGGSTSNIGVVNWQGDQLGASAGQGIPTYIAGGGHYANNWKDSRQHLEGNYEYGSLDTKPIAISSTIQLLPDTIYSQYQDSRSVNTQNQQLFTAHYTYNPDTLTAVHLFASGNAIDGQNNFFSTENSLFNGTPINEIQRSIRSQVHHDYLSGSFLWRIRGRKHAARFFSISGSVRNGHTGTDGYLYSLSNYLDSAGNIHQSDTIDQRKHIVSQNLVTMGTVNYTLPLWKKAVAGFTYSSNYTKDDNFWGSYSRGDGKYQELIDSVSSHYSSGTTNQQGIFNLQVQNKRLSYVFNLTLLYYHYSQKDLLSDSVVHYSYLNLSRSAHLNYTWSPAMKLSVAYSAATQQPSVSQLQPAKNNADPLHIVLGNPDLRPSLSQNVEILWSRFKARWINVRLGIGWISNSISTQTTTDNLGRQISKPENVNGGRSINFTLGGGQKLLGLDFGLNATGGYARSVSYLNADLSNNDYYNGGGGISLSKYDPDYYRLSYNGGGGYSYMHSSINPVPVHYWTQSHSITLEVFFLKKFEIGTNTVYSWQQAGSNIGKALSLVLWNANAARSFIEDRLVIRLQANNLLNQNAGISRSNSANIISQSQTNVLGRYFLLSVAYRFKEKNSGQ